MSKMTIAAVIHNAKTVPIGADGFYANS